MDRTASALKARKVIAKGKALGQHTLNAEMAT
jgi:hypothetical protein